MMYRSPNSGSTIAELTTHLRTFREHAGLSQAALAALAGVTRQAILAIEAGRQVPSTTLALRLASALGQPVEALFALPDDTVAVRNTTPTGARVLLGTVRSEWVAHPLPHSTAAADGVTLPDGRVRLLASSEATRDAVWVAGCAPLLSLLAARTREVRAHWLPASSAHALHLLADGLVHIAGLHVAGDEHANAREVRARLGRRPMVLVHLTRWRQGLVLAPGNPRGIRSPEDLVQPGLRLVHRDAGAGASKLLRARAPSGLPDGPVVRGHTEVGELIRLGVADAGVAIEAVARASALEFVPLSEERFDLVVPADLIRERSVARLLETMHDRAFRAEAALLAGYDLTETGTATPLAAL